MEIPFLKKLGLPKLAFLSRKPSSVVGIDIGASSTKVLQLRYESERAVLESYGELRNQGYLKIGETRGMGLARYSDADVAALLKDLIREANITTKEAVFSVPATSSFLATIPFPKMTAKEIGNAIPFEARKYVPIPLAEVALDWDILEPSENRDTMDVLLVAVPLEIVEKFKRVSQLAGLNARALEVETFSMVRALVGRDQTPTALINLGHVATTLAIADKGKLAMSHNFNRGAQEFTRALERGLNITQDRAEAVLKDIGLSDRIEDREIASIIAPIVESLFSEIARTLNIYNRRQDRKIQKINLTGGGSNLKGLIELGASRFGLEVTRGNPFARIVAPAFLQIVFREIGPVFAVVMGLALHEISNR